jgi:hypothetical protein
MTYTGTQYVYQLPRKYFARNFGVYSLLQKELLYVHIYFVMTFEYGRTYEFQVMKMSINFMIGQAGTIPPLHFYLTPNDKYPHGSCVRDRPNFFSDHKVLLCDRTLCRVLRSYFRKHLNWTYGGHAKFSQLSIHINKIMNHSKCARKTIYKDIRMAPTAVYNGLAQTIIYAK